MRRTEDLIAKLVRERMPRRTVWPAYPFLPMVLTLGVGLVLPHLLMGETCHLFVGPTLHALPTWAPGAIIALVGASLALRLASPTEGGWGEVLIVLLGSLVTLAIWPWGVDIITLGSFLRALALNFSVPGPGLVLSLVILRRGATQHPFASGLGAGLAVGGAGMALLIFQCDGLSMPDKLAAAWVATWGLGLLGGPAALRALRW